MSSFSDTFTRDENKDTQYDDSAFYTFAGSILLVSILPLIYYIFKRIFVYKKLMDKTKFKNCECKVCLERVTRHYKQIKRKNLNFSFYLMIFLVIFLCYLFYLSYFEIVKHGSNFKRFDPYEILEIETGADEKAIKQAYRKLARLYHPDKNPNNLQAKAKFILITKAYESLTDEVARKNYEMYGNPDGPGSMRLAVGLPSFVLNKKNHMPILIIFLIVIVILIPGFVLFWFSNSSKYDESGMFVGDQKIFYELLNENILLRQMPFVLGAAYEFTTMTIRQDEAIELEKLWRNYKDQMPKHKEEAIPFSNKKAICLIYAHINNQTLTSQRLQEDTNEILKAAPLLISNMYSLAVYFTQVHMFNKNIKNFGYNCVKTIIEFSQLIHQKIPVSKDASNHFYQLPYFTEQKIKNLKKLNPQSGDKLLKFNTLSTFLNYTAEERKAILEGEFNSLEIEEIENACSALPNYEFKAEAFVEGFEEILVEDFLTLKITIDRKNLDEKRELGVPHSLSFPEIYQEKALVLITIGDKIVYESLLDINKKITTHEFKHMVRDVGLFKFQVELLSFNYKGIDQTIPFQIEVKKSSENRSKFIQSIEKREPKKLEPSLFQQMLSNVFPVADDDDEEEEEDEKEKEENKENENNENNKETEEMKTEGDGNKLLEEPEINNQSQTKNNKTRRKK